MGFKLKNKGFQIFGSLFFVIFAKLKRFTAIGTIDHNRFFFDINNQVIEDKQNFSCFTIVSFPYVFSMSYCA